MEDMIISTLLTSELPFIYATYALSYVITFDLDEMLYDCISFSVSFIREYTYSCLFHKSSQRDL